MRNEATVLILQDRSIGLETLQDDLRRVQLFPLFSYVSSAAEFQNYLRRRSADVILVVQRFFEMPFEDVLHEVRKSGKDIPVIVILPHGREVEGMGLVRRGAENYLLESELQRLPPTIYLALRDHAVHAESNGERQWDLSSAPPIIFEPKRIARPEESRDASRNGSASAEMLIENMLDLVTEVDIVGTILYESPSVLSMLGYSQEELVGRNAFSLIHPLDLPRVMPIFMLALASPGIPHSARFRFKHKQGTWTTLESVGKAVAENGEGRRIVVTSRDITDMNKNRVSIGDSEARFMAVVEGLGEGLLITDTEDRILYANKQIGEFTGHEVTELLGKLSYKIFLPEQAWEIYMQQKEKWLLGNREEYEISIPHKGGEPLCMHVNVSPYRNSEGHITGTIAAFIDITNRKHAEEEVQRAFEHLQVAKERAEEMNRLKTSFLRNVTHEVRTPLNTILGFSSLLTEMLEESPRLAEYATTIETSGKRLLETMEGILDLSRVESNTVVLNPTMVSLEAEARRIVALLEPQARDKGLEITVEALVPVDAYADAHYLARIFLNVIGNAVKFTEVGSVRIQIGTDHTKGFAEIRIVDTGIGISEEFLPRLFEEFYQESSGMSRKYEGTGLGLRIAKRLLELMGGFISVESKKGKGSTFTIRLPLNIEAAVALAEKV